MKVVLINIIRKKNKSSDVKKYGYRFAFKWELESLLDEWEEEKNISGTHYEFVLTPEEINDRVDQTLAVISGKEQAVKSDLEKVCFNLIELKKILCEISNSSLNKSNIDQAKNNMRITAEQFGEEDKRKLDEGISKIADVEEIKSLKEVLPFSLALQLAVAYIGLKKERSKRRGEDQFRVSDYLEMFQEEGMPDFCLEFKDNDDIKIVAKACNIILKDIEEREESVKSKALHIISIMAYLGSDGISAKKLFSEAMPDNNENILWDIAELLEKYSMISIKQGKLSMKNLVREVIKSKLRQEDKEREFLKKVLQLEFDVSDKSHFDNLISIWCCYESVCDEVAKGEFLKRFCAFPFEYSSGLLRLLIVNNQSQIVEKILLKIDDYKLSEITKFVDETGRNILHYAAESNSVGIVKYLIKDKSFYRFEYLRFSMCFAIQSDAIDVVKYLINEVNSNSEKSYDIMCIRFAVHNGAINVVKYLIEERGVSLNNNDAHICISLAAKSNKTDVLRYLIEEQNVDYNVTFSYRFHPFCCAAYFNAIDVVKYFLDSGTLPFYNRSIFGLISLDCAAAGDAIDVVKYLIENRGVDFFSKNPEAIRILNTAASSNAINVVKYLIEERNVDCFQTCSKDTITLKFLGEDYVGCRPIDCAVKSNAVDVVKYLIEERNVIDLNDEDNGFLKLVIESDSLPDCDGTLLYTAIGSDAIAVVKYLIKERNVIDLKKNPLYANLFLDLAIHGSALESVKYLIEEEKVVDFKKNPIDVRNLLNLAVESEAGNIAEYLMKMLDIKQNLDDARALFNLAIENNMASVVEHLVDVVDLNNRGNINDFLDLALSHDAVDVVEYLVEDRGIIDLNNSSKAENLLELAVKSNALDIVKYLRERNTNFITKGGHSKVFIDLVKEKPAKYRENTDQKEFETDDEMDDNPKVYLGDVTIDNQLTKSSGF